MSGNNDKIHTIENDSFLQHVFIELVRTHVAFTGELPEFLQHFMQAREEEDKINEQ